MTFEKALGIIFEILSLAAWFLLTDGTFITWLSVAKLVIFLFFLVYFKYTIYIEKCQGAKFFIPTCNSDPQKKLPLAICYVCFLKFSTNNRIMYVCVCVFANVKSMDTSSHSASIWDTIYHHRNKPLHPRPTYRGVIFLCNFVFMCCFWNCWFREGMQKKWLESWYQGPRDSVYQ